MWAVTKCQSDTHEVSKVARERERRKEEIKKAGRRRAGEERGKEDRERMWGGEGERK